MEMSVEEFRKLKKKRQPTKPELQFQNTMRTHGAEPEYRFHPVRRWRFDFAFPQQKIAVEYEGIFSAKSRHTTISGFIEDSDKYNEAALLGWRVLRYSAKSIHKISTDLKRIIK